MDFSHQENEDRSQAIRECEILDTPAEPEFDDVTQVAAAVCGTSRAAIGLAESDRIWFKSKLGIPFSEVPRSASACNLVLAGQETLVITDLAQEDHRPELSFLQQRGIRFYAGAPVRCGGHIVGTLCVLDTDPRFLTPAIVAALDALARQVGALLDTRRANRKLLESERMLASALSAAELAREHAGLSARRLETLFGRLPVASFTCDSELTIFEWNRAAERLWNRGAYEAIMRPVPDVLGWPTENGFLRDGLMRVLKGENIENYEWKTTMADGTHRWLISSAFPLQSSRGDVVGAVCTCADITSTKENEEQLQEYSTALELQKAELNEANIRLQALATTDGLTGLRNHRFFQEFLAAAVEQARRYKHPLSLIVLDVDQFKRYNDTFGHPAGDAVLVSVGEVLTKSARGSDLVARYGGEEFVVVLPETGVEGAKRAAERLREAIESHSGFLCPLTASFGVSTLELNEDDREHLIQCADRALYSSKSRGRNRVSHWKDLDVVTMDLEPHNYSV